MAENIDSQKPELGLSMPDYIASAAKGIVGATPFAGSLLAEVAGTIIPRQRLDRIAKFAIQLEEKLSHLREDLVRAHLVDENFTDLLEESVRQVARSVTEERRAYIASLIAYGISNDSVEYMESKHLLRMLGELNDFEVLWLRYYLDTSFRGEHDQEFRSKHAETFNVPIPVIRCAQEVLYQNALKDSYLTHLSQLGLLAPRYQEDRDENRPKFDSGEFEIAGYNLTVLGKVLLRHIGFVHDNLNSLRL